jgi:catechol-2,3-dioxygenase
MAFIPVSDHNEARTFYVDALGLRLTDENPYALVLDAGGTMLRLTQVDGLRPQPFTVAGWEVTNIVEAIDALADRFSLELRCQIPKARSVPSWFPARTVLPDTVGGPQNQYLGAP